MGQRGTLRGIGTVTVGSLKIPGVVYKIGIFQTSSRGRLKADGEITGDPARMAQLGAAISTCSLELEDGESITFLVSGIDAPGGRARIEVSGPVPRH